MFITFEGGEGSGKSTQVKLLAQYFQNNKRTVVTTREPGGTPEAEEIREILLNNKYSAIEEVLLNFAARHNHIKNLIQPALETNIIVICDRFFDSTYVYQGYVQGVEIEFIDKIKEVVAKNYEPDISFILDVAPEVSLARTSLRNNLNHYDKMGIDFHQKVRQGFLEIASKNSKRCKIIDASLDKFLVHKKVLEYLQS